MRLSSWTTGLYLLAGLVLSGCGDDTDEGPIFADARFVDARFTDAPPPAIPDAGTPDAFPVPTLDRSACVPDETAPVPMRCGGEGLPPCEVWVKVDVPDAVCSNNSQYKIFINLSNRSNNLAVNFEGGGACWDYPSCSGKGGIRGAANRDGIADNHMERLQFLNMLRRSEDNPTADWNLVFVPYCTGDVHTGNKVATYENPAGGESLTYRHVGHDNVMKTIALLAERFPAVPRLLVTGCSAGGIGALQNYYYLREGLTPQCGYLLDDSGPAFHSFGPSQQLHQLIREAWNLDPLLDELRDKVDFDVDALKDDFGLVNAMIADRYPHDRLALTVYRMDFNYSLYSYQRFFPGSTEADIHAKWEQDLAFMRNTYDTRSNLAYFMPNFRFDNCSHCVSIPPLGHDLTTILTMPWLGSEIEARGLDLKQFTIDLLDETKPLTSYLEEQISGEAFSTEQSMMCMEGGG